MRPSGLNKTSRTASEIYETNRKRFPALAGVFIGLEFAMSTSEQSLINKALDGHTEAFGELVRLHQNRLFSAMVHIVGCPAEAEDVVQEAFIRAFRKLDQFSGSSNFYTWLYRIAFNRSLDRRRTRRPTWSIDSVIPEVEQQATWDEQSPSRQLELRELSQLVWQALARLSVDDRAILILREFEEFDYATISDVLGLKIGTVRSRLHRAKGRMLQELKRLEKLGPRTTRGLSTRLKTHARLQRGRQKRNSSTVRADT